MGGWVAETIAIQHPERVRAAAFLGSCNVATAWEKAITTVERDVARLDYDLPPLFFATETLRYLTNGELQRDEIVDGWLNLIGDMPAWPNPGRLGQFEACLAWSLDTRRTQAWSSIRVPCLVMAFEHDIDSPPQRAREAAAVIPGACYVEIPDASHLAPFTHSAAVVDALLDFLASTPRPTRPET
jgi:thioesterase CepJ